MFCYISKRLAAILVIMLAGIIGVFIVMHEAPGNPALIVLGQYATKASVNAFDVRWHLNDSLTHQFWLWFSQLIHGNFGTSMTIAGGVPISQLISSRLPNTLFIGVYAVFIAICLSLITGTIAAVFRGRIADTLATSAAVVGISMPDFWLSYVLIFGLALGTGWFPSYGFTSPLTSLTAALYTGFLPALAMAAPMGAVFSRILRASLLEIAQKEYVTVAKSLGQGPIFVFYHYIFRNALVSYITVVGLQIRYILGGVVVIEKIFGIAGMGSLLIDAALSHDFPVIEACAVTFLIIVLAVNLVTDLICVALDTRTSL